MENSKELRDKEGTESLALRKQFQEHAEKVGIKLNPNEKIVENIINRMLTIKAEKGETYCPCRLVTGDKEKDKEIICPCVYHRGEIELQKHCHCNLFVE